MVEVTRETPVPSHPVEQREGPRTFATHSFLSHKQLHLSATPNRHASKLPATVPGRPTAVPPVCWNSQLLLENIFGIRDDSSERSTKEVADADSPWPDYHIPYNETP